MDDIESVSPSRLAAERAMQETVFRMFRLVDARRYDEVGPTCFTPQATIAYQLTPGAEAPDLILRGRDALTDYLNGVTRHQIQQHAHVIGQIWFDWSGSKPTLSAHVFALHWFSAEAAKGPSRPADWIALGIVVDRFERFDGRWLIADRHVSNAAGPVVAGAPPFSLMQSGA